MHLTLLLLLFLALPGALHAQQNPSPMVETTRAHERIAEVRLPGWRAEVEGPRERRVVLFAPARLEGTVPERLLVHFHGAAFVAEHAVAFVPADYALAVVNLGGGTGTYDEAFGDPAVFSRLLAAIEAELGGAPRILELSGFSAGHGAIRAILRDPDHFARVDAVLVLDGIHTAYTPARTVLAEGGRLQEEPLASTLRFAAAAARGEKRMLVTHSTIFPGTFASTTETADHLLATLGLRRTAALEWGPVGMQLLSRTEAGTLRVMGFAGNSAPDHIDHLHGMGRFVGEL